MTSLTYSLSAKPEPTRQGLGNLVRAEVTKLRSVRSTSWALLVTVVGALLVTGLSADHVATRHNRDFGGFDPTNMALVGLALASLSLGVLGVLAISGEYGSGTMRSSLSAVPRRLNLMVSKVLVVGLLSLIVGEVLAFGSFFLGMGIISGSGAPTAHLGQPGVLRAVIMSGAFLALLALFALGLGFIIRHSAGAIAAFVGCTLLLPILLQGISEHLARFAPENIFANSVATVLPQGGDQLSAVTGFVLMAIYTVVVLIAGAVLFVRRDA
jgi:ABC-type transport system involved in multi-copper enzyme maturation permease subunit